MSKICSVHNIEADWKTGVSKTKKNPDGTPKSYAFWACPQRLPDGGYCQAETIEGEGVDPKSAEAFENSLRDDRSRRIERQHSQEMAIRFLEMLVHTGQITEVTKELVNLYTIHFQKDLEN